MQFVGKILVVLQLILSVFFMAFAGVVYNSQVKWREYAKKQEEMVGKANRDLSDSRAAFDRLQTDVAAKEKEFKEKIATLEADKKTLTDNTRKANARFFKNPNEVPRYAITMGVGTIMDAKELMLVANGAAKADAIKAAVEGPLTGQCPASVIQLHRKTFVILDHEAGARLSGSYPGTWRSSLMLER